MNSDVDKIVEIFNKVTKVVAAANGAWPVIDAAWDLLEKAYHEIRESPGDFNMDTFQKRLDALPDYEVDK